MADFKTALSSLLFDEGKYVNDPHDPGGATNAGITQKSWDDFRDTWKQDRSDVAELTPVDIQNFFMVQYWIPLKCRQIASQGLASALMSMSVLSGMGTAVKRLQALLGLNPDGIMGIHTLTAIEGYQGPSLVNRFLESMSAHFADVITHRPESERYRAGWESRINRYREAVA